MSNTVSLRDHVDAILSEKDRAVEMATDEREKAAAALRKALERTIEEGDDRLREHITNQIQQINAALLSADKLELERIGSVRRELQQAMASAAEAVQKAETATEKRFEGVNEWRGQSADRERSQQEQMANLTATFLPREVAEAQFAEMRKQIDENRDRLNSDSGARRSAGEYRTTALAVLVVLATIAAVISPHIH